VAETALAERDRRREIEAARAAIRAAAASAGRDDERVESVLRMVDSAGRSDDVATSIGALDAGSVDEIILGVDWKYRDPAADIERLAGAAA
jgi:hypothetical protein